MGRGNAHATDDQIRAAIERPGQGAASRRSSYASGGALTSGLSRLPTVAAMAFASADLMASLPVAPSPELQASLPAAATA